MPSIKTLTAFNAFRDGRSPKALSAGLVADPDQIKQMTQEDGLQFWEDGKIDCQSNASAPVFTAEQLATRMLWVVRDEDVPYAPEACAFGKELKSRIVKHSNLTGGATAYSGGEMLILSEDTIAINGCSGRYGPRSEEELSAVAAAFKNSGYVVWCMGFDNEVGYPFPFLGSTPTRID